MNNKLLVFCLVIFQFIAVSIEAQHNMEAYRVERERMVEQQIFSRGVKHKATLDAMRKVPRHLFVPSSHVHNAYRDSPLPIGHGQTISQPFIVAYMTEIVNPKPGQVVLEIGTGSGYQAAVLAEIVGEVYTVEIIPQLAASSKQLLNELNYNNIHVKSADGYYGWEEAGPFDAIVVTAAAEHIPPPLIDQLKDGGKMISPVGTPFFVQQLMLVEKNKEKTTTKTLMPVRFVPFTRGSETNK